MAQMTQILTCSVWDFADFGYFADNLQNFCFFLGSFEEKGYICNSIKDYKYGKTDYKKYRAYKECGY